METATENPAHPPREDLVWLARPLLELAQERSLEGVLRKAIDAEAEVPGVALARVYLLEPGTSVPLARNGPPAPIRRSACTPQSTEAGCCTWRRKSGRDWRMITDGSPWGSTRPDGR